MPSPRLLAAALVAPLLALSACTQAEESSVGDFQGEQRAVAQAVEDLQEAGTDRDGTKICEQLLAPKLVQSIRSASGTTCPTAIGDRLDDVDAFGLTVQKVQVNGDEAIATVKSDAGSKDRIDQFTLIRQGRNWRISSLGGR
jgi:hypothetical protein